MQLEQEYRLPDLFVSWPWQRELSPHYASAKAESMAWVESFKPFKAKEQAAFNKCDFNLLGCLTYPHRSKEFVRVACDLMNFYFIYDEYTDVADGKLAEEMANRVVDALRNPEKPREEGDIIGEVTKQFWNLALKLTKPNSPCIEHFITGFEEYIDAVAVEAADRAQKRIRTVRDYQELRQGTTSGKAIFALIEFGLDLPDEVFEHPTIVRMTEAAAEICGITNDMHSYRLEHARGLDGHNIITSIIHEHRLDLQSALDWLGDYVAGLVNRFLTDLENLPSWSDDIDARLRLYIDGLGTWVRGNDCWCYESKRYYGDDGDKVRETRIITLRKPETGYLKEEELKRVMGCGQRTHTSD